MDIKEIILKKDKTNTLNYLLNKDLVSITDKNSYETSFKDRNGIELSEIKKKLEKLEVKQVNEQDVSGYFNLIELKKHIDSDPLLKAVIWSLESKLCDLYCRSWFLNECFINPYAENTIYKEWVKLGNDFVYKIKSLKDNLAFIDITSENNTAMVFKRNTIVKGYMETYVSNYDVNVIKDIWQYSQDISTLLKSLLQNFSGNSILFEISQDIIDTNNVIDRFILEFPKMVIASNNLNFIYVAPKEVQYTDKNSITFYDEVQKKHMVRKKAYDVEIVKNFQGLVTGILLTPEVEDLQKQIVSEEEIYKAMLNYMLNHVNFDVMHDLNVLKSNVSDGDSRQVALIQNFVAPQDLYYGERLVLKGTWIQETMWFDENIKKDIQDGKFKGYSIYGHSDIVPSSN